MDIMPRGCEDRCWIQPLKDRVSWWIFLNAVTNDHVPFKQGMYFRA